VAMGLSALVFAGVLSSLLYISRSSLSTTDYAGFDREARQGLEMFAREVRMASDVENFSANGVTLTVPTASSSYQVNYTYVPSRKAFYRAYGTADQKLLVQDVTAFSLRRYTLLQTTATNDLETKQLQLELRALRSGGARITASNNVISARYILRNKIVSN